MGLSTKILALSIATLVLPVSASVLSSDFHTIFKSDPPKALPGCATDADKKWQPAMDFDKDGCYNTPAIDANGNIAQGLRCGGALNGSCRDESDLDNNNVYSRARCNNGWCGFLYGYYFEKDQSAAGSCGFGHRNDWEHVVVWVKDGDDMPSYVGASQHGKYQVKPASAVRFLDTHAKIVYHQDGGRTHSMRFANAADDAVENHKKEWFFGDLVGFSGFPTDELRDKMLSHNFGAAVPDIREAKFAKVMQRAKGGKNIPVDTKIDNENSPGEPQGC
ncbi:hypothetical protein CIB48_g7055 [Xylaria polymorpha]|nr:hypothetical protein CIB48_g7055 [Xylaria polymorpha]